MRFIVSLKDNASKAANALLQNINRLNTSVVTRVNLALNTAAVTKFRATMKQLGNEAGGYLGLDFVPKGFEKISSKLNQVKKNFAQAFKPPEDRSLDGWIGKLKSVGSIANKIGLSLTSAFAIGGTVTMVAGGLLLKKWVDQSVELNSQMETFQVQLRTTIGSLTAAKQEMQGIVQFAKETPYEIGEVTDAVVKLRAYAMDSDKWLKPLGDMAAAFGRPITDAVEAAADAVQGMFRRALSYGIRMERNDFKQGGKYAGMTYSEAFFSEIQKRFSGGMILQSQTLKGLLSNIKDVMNQGLVKMGQPLFDKVKKTVTKIYNFLSSDRATAIIDSIAQKVTKIVQEVGKVAQPLVTMFISTILPTITDLGSSMIGIAINVIKIFSGPMLAALTAILVPLAKILAVIASLLDRAGWLLDIFLGFNIAKAIFKALSIGVWESAVAMTALNKEGSLLANGLGILAKRAITAIAAFAAFSALSDAFIVRDNIKEIGDGLKNLDSNVEASKVKGYLLDLANASGESVKSISAAGVAAKDFGNISQPVLEAAAYSAKELGMSAENAVQVIGELAASYVEYGDTATEASEKTKEIAQGLVYLSTNQKELGINFQSVLGILDKYPEVVGKMEDGFQGLVRIIAKTGGDVKELGNLMEAMSMLLTPDDDMLLNLTAETWVSRTTDEIQDLGTAMKMLKEANPSSSIANQFGEAAEKMGEDGKLIEDTLNEWGKLLRENADLSGSFAEKASYKVEDVQGAYKGMKQNVEKLTESIETLNTQIAAENEVIDKNKLELQELAITLEDVNYQVDTLSKIQPYGTIALANSLGALDQQIRQIDLESFRLELEWINGTYREQENELRALEDAYEAVDQSLEPLRNELEDLEEQFDEVSDAIRDAQERLDKFTNPKLEGMQEFDDKIHEIDMKLNDLKRQRLELTSSSEYRMWENLAEKDPRVKDSAAYKAFMTRVNAINEQIEGLKNQREKLELDRAIAYDDQLYNLEKIGDMEEEITFEEAVSGATAAREEIERLSESLESIGARRDEVAEIVEEREKELKAMKDIVDAKQAELDAAKEAYDIAQDDLSVQKQRLELMQDIAQTQYDILYAEKLRQREQILSGEKEGDIDLVNQQLGDLMTRKTGLETRQRELEVENATKQLNVDKLSITLSDQQAALTKIQGFMQDLVKSTNSLIERVNYNVLMNTNKEALEKVFGKTIAEDIAKIAGRSGNFDPKNYGNAGDASRTGSGTSIAGQIKNWFNENIGATIGALGAAYIGGKVLGKTGVFKNMGNAAKGVVGRAATYGSNKAYQRQVNQSLADDIAERWNNMKKTKIRGMRISPSIYDDLAREEIKKTVKPVKSSKTLEWLSNKLNTFQGNKLTEVTKKIETASRPLKDALNKILIKTDNPELAEATARKLGELDELIKNGNLQGIKNMAKQLGVSKETVKETKIAGKATKGLISTIANWDVGKKITTAFKNITSGKENKISNARTIFYNLGKGLGRVKPIMEGDVPKLAGNLARGTVGKYLQNPLGRIGNFFKGGRVGIVAEGAEHLIGGNMFRPGTGESYRPWVQKIGTMLNKVGGVFGKGSGVFSKAVGGIQKIFGKGSNLGKVFSVGGKGIGAVLDPLTFLTKGAGNIMGKMGGKMGGSMLGNILGKGGGFLAGKVASKAIPVLGWLALAGDVGAIIQNLTGKSFDEMISKNKVSDWVSEHLPHGGDVVKGFAREVQGGFDALKGLSDIFGGIGSGIVGGTIGFFKGIFTGDWSYLQESIRSAAEMMKQGVINMGKGLWELLKGFVQMVKGEFLMIFDIVKWPFEKAWEWLSTNVPTWPGKIWGWLSGLVNTIGSTAWNILENYIVNPLKNAWNWISEHVANWATDIWNWVKGIPTWFKDTIWTNIEDHVVDPFQRAISRVINFFKTLPNKIWSEIIALKNTLVQAGKDLWNFIWEGMKGAYEQVKETPIIGKIIGGIEAAGRWTVDQIRGKRHKGGLIPGSPNQESLWMLRGQEAVIPLEKGRIPVEITSQVDRVAGSETNQTIVDSASTEPEKLGPFMDAIINAITDAMAESQEYLKDRPGMKKLMEDAMKYIKETVEKNPNMTKEQIQEMLKGVKNIFKSTNLEGTIEALISNFPDVEKLTDTFVTELIKGVQTAVIPQKESTETNTEAVDAGTEATNTNTESVDAGTEAVINNSGTIELLTSGIETMIVAVDDLGTLLGDVSLVISDNTDTLIAIGDLTMGLVDAITPGNGGLPDVMMTLADTMTYLYDSIAGEGMLISSIDNLIMSLDANTAIFTNPVETPVTGTTFPEIEAVLPKEFIDLVIGGGFLPGYAEGGIIRNAKQVSVLHGPEAVIPLENGEYVPVKLSGSIASSGDTNISIEMTNIVRDNEDMEEIKRFLLDLSRNNVTFQDRPSMYGSR